MPARLISSSNFSLDGKQHERIGKDMLWGQPFPPDDIQALWHMVPGNYVIYWFRKRRDFVVTYTFEVTCTSGHAHISSEDALVYEKWVELFEQLALPETGA